MNNLVIIGNGFDLAHKMETSYEQFIKYLIDSNEANVTHKDLFVRNLNYNYTELKASTESYQQSVIESCSNSKFFKSLFEDLLLKNW